ncbi:olfactory receptor 51E1-like [Pelodytes ibericus]
MTNYSFEEVTLLYLNFGEIESERYLYVATVFVIFMMIIVCNNAIIYAVVLNKSLQEPMYIFIVALCINGLYGSIAFFPSLLVNLLSKTQTISYRSCLVQAFCIHTYGGWEITSLVTMSYDRYISICNPLRYHSIMSLPTVFKLVAGAWLYTFALITVLIILTIRHPLCGSVMQRVYCENSSLMRLSCIDTTVNNIYGLFVTVALMGLMPLLIFCSYIKILRVCVRSSKDLQAKALQTCSPHLITVTVFVTNVLFEILLYRFTLIPLPFELRVFMSVQFLVVPPALNPIIYGLKMRKIRFKVRQLFSLRP